MKGLFILVVWPAVKVKHSHGDQGIAWQNEHAVHLRAAVTRLGHSARLSGAATDLAADGTKARTALRVAGFALRHRGQVIARNAVGCCGARREGLHAQLDRVTHIKRDLCESPVEAVCGVRACGIRVLCGHQQVETDGSEVGDCRSAHVDVPNALWRRKVGTSPAEVAPRDICLIK